MKKSLLAIGSALLLLASGVVPASAATQIKVSLMNPHGNPMVVAMETVFKPFVEKESKGRYVVDIYPASSMGNSDAVFQGVQFGTLHFAYDSSSNLSRFGKELLALDVPFVFPDEASIVRTFKSPIGEELKQSFNSKGMHGMSIIYGDRRNILTAKYPIKNWADCQKKKVRSATSKMCMAGLASMGFVPTPMPPSEQLTALQQGVVDAIDGGYTANHSWRLCDVGRYLYLSYHSPIVYVGFCNQKWWNSLSAEDRALFEKAFALFEDAQGQLRDKGFEESLAAYKKAGVELNPVLPEDRAKFEKSAEQVYKHLNKQQLAMVEKIKKFVATK